MTKLNVISLLVSSDNHVQSGFKIIKNNGEKASLHSVIVWIESVSPKYHLSESQPGGRDRTKELFIR